MVDNGSLTASERTELLTSIQQSLNSLNSEKASCIDYSTEVSVIEKKITTLQKRRQVVEGSFSAATPVVYRLNQVDEVMRARVQLKALAALDDKGRNMSLTLADLKRVKLFCCQC
jgi:hypothetical protein